MIIETPKEAAHKLSAPMLDKGFKPVALHSYTDADGKPLYWRIRCKHPGTAEKWIRPFKQNAHGFEFGEPKFPNGKPLYALRQIANNPDAVVWIVEGDWTVIPNLWGAVVGNSGVMKSPALAAALSPIKKLQSSEFNVFTATEQVVVTVAIRGKSTFELEIPRHSYDGLALLELIEKHSVESGADASPL